VLGKEIRDWRNGLKGQLLIKFARSSDKEFVVALDAFDIKIQGDLSLCVAELNKMGCGALFGAETNSYPNELHSIFESERYRFPFRFLNSGMMIARSNFLTEIEDQAWGCSDQEVWRDIHRQKWPQISLDDGCNVFQNINLSAISASVAEMFEVVYPGESKEA